MLRFFSRFQRSRNFVLLIFSLLLLVGLIAFYIPNSPLGGSSPIAGAGEENRTVIAKVDSREITLGEYRATMQGLSARFNQGGGNALPVATLRALGIDKEALETLIDQHIALAEADRLNIQGTDSEVSDQVRRTFVDPETGKFIGVEEYKRRLRLNGQDLGEYEQNIRDGSALNKARNFIVSAEQISEREIEETFKKESTKVDLVYATIDPEKVRSKFTPSEAELRAYYDAHLADFKATEPVRKVDYIFISTDRVGSTLKLTEEDLKQEYEQKKQYEPRLSVIRLDVLSPNDEATVRAKIEQLNQRVRGTPSVPAEDFAAVARGNSMDPSAAKGGDIGFIKKNPNRPNEWRQRAFNLEPNDIDGPFREGQSWYLLKATEKREVPFAEMRQTVEAGARNRRAYTAASQLADRAYEKATEYKDLRRAAEEIAREMNVSPSDLLRSTPFFKAGDTLPVIGSNPAFEEATAQLKKGEIGDKVGIPGGLAIPQVSDVRDQGQQLTFEEARNQVEQKLRQEREPNLAQQRAQEIVTRAKSAAEFQSLLMAEGIEVKTDTNFDSLVAPGAQQGGLQALQQARAAAGVLKQDEVAKAPIKFGPGYLIFAVTKRTEPDLSRLAGDRERIRQQLLGERQTLVYNAYLRAARKRYEDQKRIKIYQDRIDKFFNNAAGLP